MRVAGLVSMALLACAAVRAEEPKLRVSEIARGHSWVSPYWGYSAPKIVFDGETFYTAGLWGAAPEQAEGVVYRYANGTWNAGASLTGIYQPAVLLLDPQKRLLVVYTRESKPAVFLRAKGGGEAGEFEDLPAPKNMPNAYYPGAAIAGDVLYFAYITNPDYTMYLNRLDLATLEWSRARVVAEGQVETKPKTAWTYPILVPTGDGLCLVASNCPDGGDGNTYNQVWCVLYDKNLQEVRREKVAESPIGSNAYAMDAAFDADGGIHIVHMWNHRKYGDPLAENSAPEGTYHAYRDPGSGAWQRIRLAPVCLAGFHQHPAGLQVITEEGGTFASSKWDPASRAWNRLGNLIEPSAVPAGPSFVDILQSTSGSVVAADPVLVTDGLLPEQAGSPQVRILWSVLPATAESPGSP